jgi:hypothetical protein
MWNQSPLYNNLCPIDNNGMRSITGCVATAMAQIMKYWNYPVQGTGVGSYWLGKTDNLCYFGNGTHITNIAITGTYNWVNMPNSLTTNSASSEISAIAKLMYDCGISVDMSYSSSSSGACYNGRELVDHFNYDTGLHSESRTNYTDNNWKQLLYEELNNERPIWYSGYGDGVGHSWVCDGYDNTGYFHMNWGWGGYSNGYFLLDALNPSNTGYSFNSGQSAVVGIKPACSVSSPTTTGNSRCGAGSVTLSATGCAGTYNWFDASSGGSSLGMQSSFATPSISTTTTYYVACTVGNCTSTRASAIATINNIPSAPTIAPVTINSGQTATLNASNCNTGTVKWYNANTGGSLLFTGNPYGGLIPTTTTTYYASCSISGCESATRGSGTVTVNPVNNPCPPTITHNTGVLTAGTYQAGQTINSKANISSPTTFKAGQSILFTNGFSAGPNETFLAKIEGCNANTIPTNGLVAFFSLDGDANDTGGNMGTVSGATLTTDRKGVANKAYSFDGNDKITATDNNLPTGNTPRTFSIWVYSSSQQSNTTPATLLSYGTPSMSFQHCSFVMWGNKLRLSNWSGAPDIDYTYSHPVNQWFHLVVKLDESNVVKIYVNGALQHTSSIMETWSTVKNGQLIFGENLVQGKLDEIRIYNRAITDTEVLQIYNVEKP